MTPTSLPISETELVVLKTLWAHGPGTVREIRGHLDLSGRSWAYTTVQTLLTRLVAKRYVVSKAPSKSQGRAHEFRAARSREAFLGEQLDDLAERVCEGTSLPLVMSLVQGRRFSADEIRDFRQLLDDMETPPTPRKRRRNSKP